MSKLNNLSLSLSPGSRPSEQLKTAGSNFCIYLPPANEVWGKVIFLHLFVILFTGGGVCLSACWDTPPGPPPPGPATSPPGTSPPPGSRHPPPGTPRNRHTPPTTKHAGSYGQRAGGTHPTGMQSC